MSEELTVVAVDAMGGDNAPGELVKGAVNAVKDEDNIKVILEKLDAASRTEAVSIALRKHLLKI